MQADPWEINNLVGSKQPEHLAALQRLRAALEQWIKDTNDQGQYPEPASAVAAEQPKRKAKAGKKAAGK
jgi:hypothetical protein